jgi:hypothetical protein
LRIVKGNGRNFFNTSRTLRKEMTTDSPSVIPSPLVDSPDPTPSLTCDEPKATDTTSVMSASGASLSPALPVSAARIAQAVFRERRRERVVVAHRAFSNSPRKMKPKRPPENSRFEFVAIPETVAIAPECVNDASPFPHEIVLRSSDDVSSAFHHLMLQRVLPPQQLVRRVHAMIKSESVKAIVAENYDYAAELEAAAEFLRSKVDGVQQNETEKSIQRRLHKAQLELQAENREWDEVLDGFREAQHRQRKAMLDDHIAAQAEYEERWTRATALLPYSKPSAELLQLRKMQKALARAKRFKEAKEVKERADAMQAKEAQVGEMRAMASIRAGFEALKERQQKAVECFEEHERRSIAFLEQERARVIEPIMMLIRSLENAYERFSEQHVAVERRPATRTDQPARAVAVRPATSLMTYRTSEEPPRLQLNAQAVRKFAAQKRQKMISETVR